MFKRILMTVGVFMLAFCFSAQAFALSAEQRAIFERGVYFYNVNDNLDNGLGGLLGSSCFSIGLPTINDPAAVATAINNFIDNNGGRGAPLSGLGDQIVEGATRAGINPFIVVSIARKESSFGQSKLAELANNSFGRTATDSQPHIFSGDRNWYKWSSFAASVNSSSNAETDEATYLNQMYLSQGLTDIQSMVYKYAPKGENNTELYIQQLKDWVGQLISLAGDSIDCGVSGSATGSNFVLYSQFDPKWTSLPYGSSGDIGSSGCGPSSMAMVVTNMTGQNVTPDIIASRFGQFHIPNQGSSSALFPAVATAYNLKAQNIGTDLQAAARALANGSLVITGGQGTKPFTGSGHILVLRGVTSDGRFLLGDPNTKVPPGKDPENSNPISKNQLLAAGLQYLVVISK